MKLLNGIVVKIAVKKDEGTPPADRYAKWFT